MVIKTISRLFYKPHRGLPTGNTYTKENQIVERCFGLVKEHLGFENRLNDYLNNFTVIMRQKTVLSFRECDFAIMQKPQLIVIYKEKKVSLL
jgi:hypothetical protein